MGPTETGAERLHLRGGLSMWKPGYVSHGLLDHSIDQAMELLSSSGYSALGITLGPTHLDPWKSTSADLETLRK